MRGLLGQYDYGITGLDSAILPTTPLYLSQIITPTARLVAYITVEAFLLDLGSEAPPLEEAPPQEDDARGVFVSSVFEPDVFVLVAEDDAPGVVYAYGVYENGVYE